MDRSLYLYCVASGSRDETLDVKGIGGESVVTIASGGIAAVVQECDQAFFSSEDPKIVSSFLLTHQAVVDLAWERYETVVPFSFDTIVIAKEEKSARENLIAWLEKERSALKQKIARFRGKAEYGVQILWDPAVIAPRVTGNDAEVQRLEGDIRSQSPGTAYLLGQKLEKLLGRRMSLAADVYFKEFFRKIRACVDEVRVGKVREDEPPRRMLANLSCLVPVEDMPKLGEQLDGIGKIAGFYVRFTGPWPPYSFAG